MVAGSVLPMLLTSPPAAGLGLSYPLYFYVSIALVMLLKVQARRKRPVVCAEVSQVPRPYTQAITDWLQNNDANGSFPSGDVAGAVAAAVLPTPEHPRAELGVPRLSVCSSVLW